ncbi:MAG TPA: hypothetical protein VG713_18005 [Pirellulales bacterium]|nr:hypothetical protein [Pirellulales bacterium]
MAMLEGTATVVVQKFVRFVLGQALKAIVAGVSAKAATSPLAAEAAAIGNELVKGDLSGSVDAAEALVNDPEVVTGLLSLLKNVRDKAHVPGECPIAAIKSYLRRTTPAAAAQATVNQPLPSSST